MNARYIAWVILSVAAGVMVCGGNVEGGNDATLNRSANWRAKGSGAATVEFDREENAIRFRGTFDTPSENNAIWPLLALPGGLPGAASISFEMKLFPDELKAFRCSIHFAAQNGVSGSFPFTPPQAGTWQRIEVPLVRSGFAAGNARTIQWIVRANSKEFGCLVRNMTVRDVLGKELQTPTPPPMPPQKPAQTDSPVAIRPKFDLKRYYVEPGVARQLEFDASGCKEGESVEYIVSNYCGEQVGDKKSAVVQNGTLILTETFASGYHEITFSEKRLVFGFFAFDFAKGKKVDPFFAIEGLIDTRTGEHIRDICEILLRGGIGSNREWCGYDGYEPVRGKYNANRDLFYSLSGAMGMRSIFCFANFPKWYEPKNVSDRRTIPRRLLLLDDSLRGMLRRRADGLEAFHILNEYDVVPCPTEANLPVVKAAAYAMRDSGLLFVGAPFCKGTGSEQSIRESLRNGLLEHIDAFAFHNYQSPETIVPVIRFYRDTLAGTNKQWLPLWLTESGKPWNRGLEPGRIKEVHGGPLGRLHPGTVEDETSALWIAMKGVEAKAGGVAKYFPFTLHFFQENNNNFGMLDYCDSPLRSFAAYLCSVRELSGKSYIGDWKRTVKNVPIARFFADGDSCVCALYTGTIGKSVVSLKGLPVRAVRSVDGAELALDADRNATVYGGLAWVVCDKTQITAEMVDPATEAMSLLKGARNYRPVERVRNPVVYQFEHWRVARRDVKRYYMDDSEFRVNVFNLGDREETVSPKLTLAPGMEIIQSPIPLPRVVPPKSETELVWKLDTRKCKAVLFDIDLSDERYPGSNISIPFLNMDNMRERTFDFMNPKRWKSNSSGKSVFSFDEMEGALKVSTTFASEKGGYWVFPEYVLDLPRESLEKAVAVSFDLKFRQKNGAPRVTSPLVMFANPKTMKGYHSSEYGKPTGEWGRFMVTLDPGTKKEYSLIRVGMCPTEDRIDFWIKNVNVYFTE